MPDPFAAALDAMFASIMAVDATYQAAGGAAIAVRACRDQGSQAAGDVMFDTNAVSLRRSEVSDPHSGDLITFGTDEFEIQGAPSLDAEGLTWRCELVPL